MRDRRSSRQALLKLLLAFLSGLISGTAVLQWLARLRKRRAMSRALIGWGGRRRRPIIGVTGSGSREEAALAGPLGVWCAESGFHVLTGGGGGVMQCVSRAFLYAREGQGGLVLGVLPGLPAAHAEDWTVAREQVTSKLLVDQSGGALRCAVVMGSCLEPVEERIVAPRGYPNEFVELAVHTHLPSSGGFGVSPLSRNHVSVLSVDVLVALPGGVGTASEVELAVRYGVPVCQFLGANGRIEGLSEPVAANSPAFERLEDVEAFVREALLMPRQRTSDTPRLQRRRTSHDGLELLG
mmetsp:Transcript_153262/g.372108  ORF Transcript_153262/g.372108 Transcript_153262/m.372108 type:complete len:296 (-) Transcript_153262:115-1002(-)